MEIRSIVKGTAAGITAGTVCYMISKASESKKRSIKKSTVKAAKAVSGMVAVSPPFSGEKSHGNALF